MEDPRAPKALQDKRYPARERWGARSNSRNWIPLFEFSKYFNYYLTELVLISSDFGRTDFDLSVKMLSDRTRS